MLFIMEVARVHGNTETIIDQCIFDAPTKDMAEPIARGLATVVYQPFSVIDRRMLTTRWISLARHIRQLRTNGTQLSAKLRREFVFIPAGAPGEPETFSVAEGYYSRNDFVGLMRANKDNPDVISYLADMLEE